MGTYLILGGCIWVVTAVMTYGIAVAYFRQEWPWRSMAEEWRDRRFAVFLALLGGPVGLVVIWCMTRAMRSTGGRGKE